MSSPGSNPQESSTTSAPRPYKWHARLLGASFSVGCFLFTYDVFLHSGTFGIHGQIVAWIAGLCTLAVNFYMTVYHSEYTTEKVLEKIYSPSKLFKHQDGAELSTEQNWRMGLGIVAALITAGVFGFTTYMAAAYVLPKMIIGLPGGLNIALSSIIAAGAVVSLMAFFLNHFYEWNIAKKEVDSTEKISYKKTALTILLCSLSLLAMIMSNLALTQSVSPHMGIFISLSLVMCAFMGIFNVRATQTLNPLQDTSQHANANANANKKSYGYTALRLINAFFQGILGARAITGHSPIAWVLMIATIIGGILFSFAANNEPTPVHAAV